MKQTFLVLQNSLGQTVRVMPYVKESLEVVYRHDSKRLEFVSNSQELTDEGIEFDSIGSIEANSQLDKTLIKGPWGQVKHVESVDTVLNDLQEKKEDVHEFPFFVKWTSIIQVSSLALILLVGWYINTHKEADQTEVVQVFKRPEQEKIKTVSLSKHKIKNVKISPIAKKVAKKAPVKTPTHIAAKKVVNPNIRSGNDLKHMGALSALGGMNLNSNGLGGLSQSASKSSGYGFDQQKAAGGSRGMLGQGLMQAGIGSGQKIQGYDGYGTSGKGHGQAGFGNLNMAGRSGGYYLPLSEEAIIEGGLDPDQVNAVIQRHKGQLTYCYEKGLQVSPKLSGRVAVYFVISPNGIVNAANVTNTSLDSKQVESCIVSKLQSWKFPKPKGHVAVKVTYPFILKRLNQS